MVGEEINPIFLSRITKESLFKKAFLYKLFKKDKEKIILTNYLQK